MTLANALIAISIAAQVETSAASVPEQPRFVPDESWRVPALHGLGLMTGMRAAEALIWPDPFADLRPSFMAERYADAYTKPPRWDSSLPAFEWDGDPWYVNAIGHGLFGSELYLRARSCRKSFVEALIFTGLSSAVWEYGFEANGVRPSALDLWYTPLSGLVIGEARYLGWSLGARIRDRTWRSVVVSIFDPFGELERALGSEC